MTLALLSYGSAADSETVAAVAAMARDGDIGHIMEELKEHLVGIGGSASQDVQQHAEDGLTLSPQNPVLRDGRYVFNADQEGIIQPLVLRSNFEVGYAKGELKAGLSELRSQALGRLMGSQVSIELAAQAATHSEFELSPRPRDGAAEQDGAAASASEAAFALRVRMARKRFPLSRTDVITGALEFSAEGKLLDIITEDNQAAGEPLPPGLPRPSRLAFVAERASSEMVNGISLYERADTIEQCYKMDVPGDQEVGTARALGEAVLAEFETSLTGITRVPRIDLIATLFERAAREHFPHIANISAAEILAGKSDGEIERLLKTVHARSSPFIRLNRQTPGFAPEHIVHNSFVGILGGTGSTDRHVQELLPYFGRLPGLRGAIYPLPDSAKDEILIGQEIYTFPLRAIGPMENLQADYKRYMAEGDPLPIHVRAGWDETLPDHVPVALEIEREARMAAAVGLALGLITHRDSGSGWMYQYVGEAGVEVPTALTDEEDFSLLWRELAEEAQVRQYLNRDIEAAVEKAATEDGTHTLHARLNDYLQRRATWSDVG